MTHLSRRRRRSACLAERAVEVQELVFRLDTLAGFAKFALASAGAYTYVAAVARIPGKSFRESRNASLFHAQARQSAPLLDLN